MRHTVRFLLGDDLIEIENPDPTETVLNWLRLRAGRPGTKEGCAEGDCGACTVVVARPDRQGGGRGGLSYRAINPCIQFLPTLDGGQLLTVEDLSAPDAPLHGVQQAMVDHHGSQCGFCTPGVVMSLFAATKNKAQSRDDLKRALAGNLCRCTGYGPILTAGEAILTAPANDDFDTGAGEVSARLLALDDGETVALKAGAKRYFSPVSLAELDALLAREPHAHIIAGLTDVGLWVTKQGRRLETLIFLGRVAELAHVAETDGVLDIAAGVTLNEATPYLADFSPGLGELLRRFASNQIRNCATVCGNIANGSPIGDLPPALIALKAELVLRRNGKRRTVALEDFFIDYGRQDRAPGELVETVRIPRPGPEWKFRCYKISKRFEQDISAVMAAFAVRVTDGGVAQVRLAYGGMAGVPKRAAEAEAALTGKPFTEANIQLAMAALALDFAPLDDMRASAAYRLAVARNLLLKFFHEVETPGLTISVEAMAHG
ncbi:Xanthine dehydrogenase iron-sulfur subunit / Xanthine dehydrogenase, FAD binding subunit [hydrothermal vent metagenome]|uniref:Xanthine dehydrogenase iron-sulfur subunit / Xanthine dehydrogenase, FAD binding subunit n=1 Tax=hydrothermal vent metagenome TaxID=652676 RepID=A0A3B0T0C1_9ZZZZ